jgi:lysozyme family protein
MANANFDKAFELGELNEGGWALLDGGTYEGIAHNFHPAWVGWLKIDAYNSKWGLPTNNYKFAEEEIPGLEQDVKDFYEVEFWDKMHGDDIVSRPVAIYFYDWDINSASVAVKHLQSLLGIAADGDFGTHTLDAVNDAGDALLDKLHASRDQFYAAHVAFKPEDAKFLTGWIKRSDNTYNELKAA